MKTYLFKKKYLFYPDNTKNNDLNINFDKKIKYRILIKCINCEKDIFSYECENCISGIAIKDLYIKKNIFKILPNLEKLIKNLLNKYSQLKPVSKNIESDYNKKDLIKKIKSKEKINNKSFLEHIFNLNKNCTSNEILYYASKSLDLIDDELVFLQKLYQYFYCIYFDLDYGIYNFYYYTYFKKFEYLLKFLKLNLPVDHRTFLDIYQNTNDLNYFLFTDIYPLDKEYKSPSYSKKNIIYDFNFLKAAECRIKDKNLKSGEVNKNSAIIKQTRDEIREEFEIKTKNKNLVNENLLFLNLKKLLNKKQILRNFRPSFLKGLELDFYFETKNKKIAIEYQGIQHYKPIKYFGGKKAYNNQREKDLLKSQLCKKNKIHLIEFPYTLQNNLSNLSMLLNINGITKN